MNKKKKVAALKHRQRRKQLKEKRKTQAPEQELKEKNKAQALEQAPAKEQ